MFSKTLVAFVALAAYARANCVHGTYLSRRQEGQVKVSDFSYTGETGPLNWAGLKADNIACRTASVQSPIVLDQTIPFATEVPQISIAPVAEAEFENLGTTLETIVTGTTTFGGANFTLQQFHLHTPSEHRINEEYFPLEMHMVHEAADGSGAIAVIAVPFQLSEDGTTTQLLTAVTENLAQVQTPGTATKTGALDFTELVGKIQSTPLFQYTGSLTTPPCAEGLTFLVVSQPLALDVKTFNALKSTMKFNARYTQNTLGKTNLLDVASQLAAREAGLDLNAAVAGGGAAAAGNGTVVVDGQQVSGELLSVIQELQKQDKAFTISQINLNVGQAGSAAGQQQAPPAAGENNNAAEEEARKKAEEEAAKKAAEEAAKKAEEEAAGKKAEENKPATENKAPAAENKPAPAPPAGESIVPSVNHEAKRREANIKRSRISRRSSSAAGKRRLQQ